MTENFIPTISNYEKIFIKMDSTELEIKSRDALAYIGILANIEKLYYIKFSLSEMWNMKNISTFIKTIKEKINKS